MVTSLPVEFSALGPPCLRIVGRAISYAFPQRLMDPDDFLKALRCFPSSMVGSPVDTQTSFWNRDLIQAVDMTAPRHQCLGVEPWDTIWFTEELRATEWLGWKIERCWQKTKS